MMVEALLEKLESEFIACHKQADIYTKSRNELYKIGDYKAGLWCDLQRAKLEDEAAQIRKIINEIEKRVS